MKLPSQTNPIVSLFKGDDWNKFKDILELIPQACFLVDPLTRQVYLFNQVAINLMPPRFSINGQYTLDDFFPGVPTDWLKTPREPLPTLFNFQNDVLIEGELRSHSIGERNKVVLLTFAPSIDFQDAQKQNEAFQKLWIILRWMIDLLHTTPTPKTIQQSLEVIAQLIGCDQAWVYTAMAEDTALINSARYGEKPSLPDLLPIDYLIQYQTITIWNNPEPPDRELIQYAIQNQQKWMGILPIGETDARIGLLVLAARQVPRVNFSIEQWQILAQLITTIFQYYQQIRNLNKSLAIQERENLIYRRIHQLAKEGIILIAQNHQILKLNPAAEAILGYTAKEALQQPIESFLISEKDLSPYIRNAINGVSHDQLRSIRLFRRSGQSFLADINLFPIIFDQKVSGAVILIQDRTEQEKLIKQSMRLEQSAILGEFTTIFAHEVRNPINNISSNLQWMSMNMDQDDPNQVIIQRLLQNCDRLNDLMDTILSYNRINEIEKEKIDLGGLVKKVLDRHQLKLNQTNIQTYFETQPNLPLIKGNQRALERVFENLIDNAMQVMKENGGNLAIKVHSTVSKENQPMVEVSIADNGPGIADEYKDKILKVSFTTKQNGTGIGLMISQKIVQAHAGVIEYDSVPGGTVFYVRIPAMEVS